MKRREQFDLHQSQIGSGTMLIEASAGTGKTFTISVLVLRLLLERPELAIDRILVTTFTELATAELRTRIRTLLQEAIAAFRTGQTKNEVIAALLLQHEPGAALLRLEEAHRNFDQAPIFTIHGFCQRVLAERAFESGTLFDAELVTNQSALLREIAYDFWRRHFYRGERFSALLALQSGITPHGLSEHLEELIRHPTLRVLPEKARSLGKISAEIGRELTALRRHWAQDEQALRALFAEPSWAKHSHADPNKMLPLLDDLGACLSETGGTVEQLACLEFFTTSMIEKRVRAGQTTPRSPVFDGCERLVELSKEFSGALLVEFSAWARDQLHERKQRQNILSFDDLLTRLNEALAAPGGEELAASIREKYQAALIDEFQDTDPVQYSIISRIYAGSSAPVALIGDPKQAIYAFRGADVFTYMEAATAAQRQFTLTTNWRSESALIEAVNTIFDRPNPFLLEQIQFDRAKPGPQADLQRLEFPDGKKDPPFHLWIAEKDDDLPESIASGVVRLLQSGATLGGETLQPRHLAVLTSTNSQAAQIQAALRNRRVPGVLYSSANIFTSHEAGELRDVLAAVAQPGYEKFVRAALCTDALGRHGNDLERFTHDEHAWEEEVLRFQKHHQIWRDRGFIQMLRHLAATHGVRRRLLSYPDGERRLTNFLHLAELLHTACVEHQLGMNGVLKWLGQEMEGDPFADREEHELRLESDEKAVRIITVHKSKGLEFDIVFCPFVWWTRREPRAVFHDPAAAHRLTIDLSDPKAHRERRDEEARAEQLRQFYVALTRARHRCVMTWKPVEKDKSAPAHLLENSQALPAEIESCAEIAVAALPPPTDRNWRPLQETEIIPQAREFTGQIDRSWGIASFTRLISGREATLLDEGPPVEPAIEEIPEATGIHAFPRGMQAGTCLHEILEEIDFSNLTNAPDLSRRHLRACGIQGFGEVVDQAIERLAELPLQAGPARLRLRDLPNESRIAELEFFFPINSLTIGKLAQVCALEKIPLQIERLQFQPLNGFMKGFIDLTFAHDGRFYFADWKSNWLGPNTAAYGPEAIATEMERHFYTLQLCLYSVALHRYLQVRKPDYDFDQHFGGAFYIFLRGIDPDRPRNGVHFQRLGRAFIEQLSRIFES